MKDISKTSVAGIAMLMVVAACLVMLVMGKLTVGEAAIAIGMLASALGHLAAQDANTPITVSRTTLEETKEGQVVKVSTELPPEEPLAMDRGTEK